MLDPTVPQIIIFTIAYIFIAIVIAKVFLYRCDLNNYIDTGECVFIGLIWPLYTFYLLAHGVFLLIKKLF